MSAALASSLADRRSRSGLGSSRSLTVALCAALALPLLALPLLAGVVADALGDCVGSRLARAFSPISSVLATDAVDDAEEQAALTADAVWSRAAPGSTKSAHSQKWAHQARAAHGLHISSAQVLALAARRAMPQATPVHASENHPSGLVLRSVSALGVGLQDGDVLTEAAGQKASSVAAVMAVVIAARGRHSREISGRFYRAGVPYALTVEQPYPSATEPG